MTSKQRWQFGILCSVEAAADTLAKEARSISTATRIKLQQVVAKCDRMKIAMGGVTDADVTSILTMHDRVCAALRVGDRPVDTLEWMYSCACLLADEVDRLRLLRPDIADEYAFLEGMITDAVTDIDTDMTATWQMDMGQRLAQEIRTAMI